MGRNSKMKYKVLKLTVGRKELYDHYKKGTELTDIREETDIVNQVEDRYALPELIYTTFFKGRAGPTEKTTDKE